MANIFIAYPSDLSEIGDAIEAGAKSFGKENVLTWRHGVTPGEFIGQAVRERISECEVLIADVTIHNFNVTYEIGYAIGLGKKVIPIVNKSIKGAAKYINDLGIFDTIFYESYENSVDVNQILRSSNSRHPLFSGIRSINSQQPCYLLDALRRTDFANGVVSCVKRNGIFFRSFDPREDARMSTPDAIKNVSSSACVIIPFLKDHIDDSTFHNLRGAFIAGLSHAMKIETVLLQHDDSPIPIDYRDFVRSVKNVSEIDDVFRDIPKKVLQTVQSFSRHDAKISTRLLEQIDLGASAAENEYRSLGAYFVDTFEFKRALRGEGRLIVGRKGAGKTAIFWQVRDSLRSRQNLVVLDLKPETYQLRKLKEKILNFLSEGTKEHTIWAFWEYILYLEISRSILDNDKYIIDRDKKLYDKYLKLDDLYFGNQDTYMAEGDFSERLSKLIDRISERFRAQLPEEKGKFLSQPEITEIIYIHNLPQLREQVHEYMEVKEGLWLLIDNIDKGWPARGITEDDALIVRTLVEATRRIERRMSRAEIDAHTLIFIRNDVYEHLIENTPDRGKEGLISIDWTDPDLLRRLLLERLVYSGVAEGRDFYLVWQKICCPAVNGEESSAYLIDRSLMRPRFLLRLVELCLSHAINIENDKIEQEDIEKGLVSYSMTLLKDIGMEIRDIDERFERLPQIFIGLDDQITEKVLHELLEVEFPALDDRTKAIDHLLWYGVLGVVEGLRHLFIFDVHYDFEIFMARVRKIKREKGNIDYVIHKAFWPALEVN